MLHTGFVGSIYFDMLVIVMVTVRPSEVFQRDGYDVLKLFMFSSMFVVIFNSPISGWILNP